MEVLYHQTNLLIQETQQCFQQLERHPQSADEIENAISQKISTVKSNCEKLDVMLYKVPMGQRQNAKMRCDQLKYDNRHLAAALSSWQSKRSRRKAELEEREQLLSRRFAPNAENTAINIDYAIQQQSSLQGAHRGVDEMLFTGGSVLDSLRSQRNTLKGARKRIMDMANTLGLSNETMRLIERRIKEDKYVFYGGIILTMFVILLVVFYFR